MAPSEKRTAYRTRQQTGILLAGVLVYVSVWGVGIVQVAASSDASLTRRVIGITVIAAHLAFVIWFAGYRSALAGVFAGPRDVIIRNPWRSHRLPWERIESFSVEPHGAYTMGYVHTTEGDSISIFGIQGRMPALFPKSRWAEEPIAELNHLLEQRRPANAAESA